MSMNDRLKAFEARLAALEARMADVEEDVESLEEEAREDKHVNPFDMPLPTGPISVPFVQTIKLYDCGCPENYVCMNTACPRSLNITYTTGNTKR